MSWGLLALVNYILSSPFLYGNECVILEKGDGGSDLLLHDELGANEGGQQLLGVLGDGIDVLSPLKLSEGCVPSLSMYKDTTDECLCQKHERTWASTKRQKHERTWTSTKRQKHERTWASTNQPTHLSMSSKQ